MTDAKYIIEQQQQNNPGATPRGHFRREKLIIFLSIFMQAETMDTIILKRSTRKGKKYMVEIDSKTIHFGAKGYEDYTIHHDEARK